MTTEQFQHIRGVAFDLDGTLAASHLDFAAIKREAGVPGDTPILEYMAGASPQERARIEAVLDRHELYQAETCGLKDGAAEVCEELRRRGIKCAILTRNSRRSVETVLGRHGIAVDVVVTREDAPPKPSPDPVLLIARRFGVEPRELLVVGDYVFDIEAGRAAGALTALFLDGRPRKYDVAADVDLASLTDLLSLLPA